VKTVESGAKIVEKSVESVNTERIFEVFHILSGLLCEKEQKFPQIRHAFSTRFSTPVEKNVNRTNAPL
jgi:hypothetical protein